MYDSSLGDPVWMMECKNPRTNFFFSVFCRALLFSQLLFGHVLQMWQCDFTHDRKQVVNTKTGSRCPRVSPHHCFMAGMKFLQGDKSVVIYCKKNYLLYKDTTCLQVFSEPWLLELLARPSIKTSSCRALFFSEWFS